MQCRKKKFGQDRVFAFGGKPIHRVMQLVERSRCFRITPQGDLPRPFTALSGGSGIWSTRVSYTDDHFRLGSRDRMR